MANKFEYIQKLRDELAKKSEKKVKSFYEEAYKQLEEYVEYLEKHAKSSGKLTMTQANELMSQIRNQLDSLSSKLYNLSYSLVGAMIAASNSLFGVQSIGYNSNVINLILTGSIYGSSGSWSLSTSIWGDNTSKYQDIYKIVANGLLMGESVQQVSEKIMEYVNPSKLFFWKGPGNIHIYSHKIDYNSQRLVRTLTTHAYQKAVLDATYDDPSLIGYRWIANGSRACPICLDRDGTVYGKDQVPWDHPNGMCYIEPVYDSKKKFQQIAEWLDSEEGDMPDMDSFMKKYLDMI